METFELIDLVIEQIKNDIEVGDHTAIVELLKYAGRDAMVGYLPEGVLEASCAQ